MDGVKSGVFNPVPKIKDLHVLGKGVYTILVEIVLFDVLVDVVLKSETMAFRIEPVCLEVLDDPVLRGSRHSLSKEVSVKGTVSLSTVLGLEELLRVGPCRRLPPVVLEGGEYHVVVSEEGWGLNAVLLKGL